MPEVRLIDGNRLAELFETAAERGAGVLAIVYRDAAHLARTAPTIEAEPVRHGRWIPTEYDSYADGVPVWDKWECSECGHDHSGEEDTLTAFCPDCGVRMDGGADT